MFDKILIANRGEIACRVMRTARRLGIATVAVHSDADAQALHVRLADEALRIGPAPARESYLVGERILEAARRSGAQAIHPGYGFLSENADFAEACAAAGLVFIGPPPSAIRAMGLKSAAKALMARAGVPLTPGYHGDDQSPRRLAAEAAAIGYPVLIKASAGGGGKGMRRVDDPADFEAALAACQREARNAFGDDAVLIESYILQPRHIEIQVFADRHGGCVHLFERDCSLQRRHQKVLEEAPAPGMTPERRAAMGRAAVDAARAVGYEGAGTVEFIATQDGRFHFMEMNTRLQVEHPVTECVTGLDLVEWQLRVAAGQPLPLTQEQLGLHGHAIEVRLYAEDPARGFLPSTGTLHALHFPADEPSVRVDSGVEAGDAIGPHYDPMIAKLIVHGEDRPQAIARLRRALDRVQLLGPAHNVDFLARLVALPAYAEARIDTGLIERELATLCPPPAPLSGRALALAALAELLRQDGRAARVPASPGAGVRAGPGSDVGAGACVGGLPASPWQALDGWRLNGRASRHLAWRHGEVLHEVEAVALDEASAVERAGDVAGTTDTATTAARTGRGWRLSLWPGSDAAAGAGSGAGAGAGAGLGPRTIEARGTLADDGTLCATLDGHRLRACVLAAAERRQVHVDGERWSLVHVDPRAVAAADEPAGAGLRAPMPGKVIALLVVPGAAVEAGTPLLLLEAMKMEHAVSAPHRGIVRAFRCAPGEQVAEGTELVDFERTSDA